MRTRESGRLTKASAVLRYLGRILLAMVAVFLGFLFLISPEQSITEDRAVDETGAEVAVVAGNLGPMADGGVTKTTFFNCDADGFGGHGWAVKTEDDVPYVSRADAEALVRSVRDYLGHAGFGEISGPADPQFVHVGGSKGDVTVEADYVTTQTPHTLMLTASTPCTVIPGPDAPVGFVTIPARH